MEMYLHFVLVLLLVYFNCKPVLNKEYQPNWASIDSRPLPPWFDEAKIGVFMHWGVFSVPSFGSEWFWYSWQGAKQQAYIDFMKKNYRPGWTYADFASQFTAEFFDPDHWADILKASGIKYVVLTSKHHEGFTNWPSKVSFNWNSMDVGPKRDLVGDLANSIRKKTDIKFGLYHSMFEWFNPMYLQDKANKFKTQKFVEDKTLPELYELVDNYKPEVIWSDGDWEAPYTYWNSTEFLAWLYNKSPVKDTVVVNDRWGGGTACHHGGFYTCSDRYNPGHLVNHKWENAMTIDKRSWGFVRQGSLSDYLSIEDLVSLLVETVSCGGNLLMNIGPTHDGRIVPIFEERLKQMGQWLNVNGEAIYKSKPWTHQNDTVTPDIWYTWTVVSGKTTAVYGIALKWPGDVLSLGAVKPSSATKVNLLGYSLDIKWKKSASGSLDIVVPQIPYNKMPCKWGWVFKLTSVSGQ